MLGAQDLTLPFTGPKDCVFGACPSGTEKKGTLIPCASTPGHLAFPSLAPPSVSLRLSFLTLPPLRQVAQLHTVSSQLANTQIIQIRLSFRVYLGC